MMSIFRTTSRIAVVAAMLSVSQLAHGATRVFLSLTANPATTNLAPGVATNISVPVTIATGSSGSTSYTGPGLYSLSLSPAEPTISLSLSTTNFNLPIRPSSDSTTLFFSTTAGTPSNTYTVTIVGNTNPPTSGVTPITNTFVVTMSVAAPFNPLKTWAPAGANTNWSVAGNWSPIGAPGSSTDIRFFDAGAVGTPGTVNNFADTSFTLGSLSYRQTNNTHTTQVASGTTLRVTGTNGLNVGTATDNGDNQITTAAITGAGASLVVSNTSASVSVAQSHSTINNLLSHSQAALDLSGLDKFAATISRLLIGTDLSIKGGSGILKLARTNTLSFTAGSTAPQLDVGDNSQSGGTPTVASLLFLGQTNSIFADSIAVGRGKTDANGASMLFNPSFANSVAWFRGANGTGRVASWSIGDGLGSRTYYAFGTNDFTSGTVNALVDTMFIGKGAAVALGAGANDPGNGYLIFNAGTVDVNSLSVGYTIDGTGAGTVNANGGSLIVNTLLELGHGAASSGTLNISGATVTANNGILAGGGSAVVTLNSGSLSVSGANATIGSQAAPLSALAITNSTLTIAAQIATPTASTASLSSDGAANTINISSIPPFPSLPAQFTLVQYTAADGNLNNFILGTTPAGSPAYGGYISNNVANNSLDLVLTSGPVTPPLVWNGNINGNWDTTTANWKTNGQPSTYQQGYPIVRFDDTLTGASTVNLTTTLAPGSATSSLTVNNSVANYTFSGTGKISGVTGLNKLGTANLVLDNSGSNDFTGAVIITDGSLQIGNNTARGNLPANVAVTDNSHLTFDRSDDITVGNVISGTGTVSKIGTGTLTLSGTNTLLSGEVVVSQGTLKLGSVGALGATTGGTTVTNGGTLDVNGLQINNTEPYTVSGAGVGNNGAIINSGVSQTRVTRIVTLIDNTTFGGTGDWDIRSSQSGSTVNGDGVLSTGGQPYTLTKMGTNQFSLFGVQVDGALGNIVVQAGTFSVQRNTTSLGNPSSTLTVFTNGTFELNQLASTLNKVVVLNDGATLRSVNTNTFAGPITLQSGTATASIGSGAQLTLTDVISGSGGLTKSGASALVSSAANTYTGDTTVSAGTLALTGSGSINNSANINVTAGAVLDASARSDSTLTLTSGQTLKGNGTVLGAVIAASGSTVSPGSPGAGTLTISNSLTLQAGSTTAMQIDKSAGTNDQVRGLSSVTYGGTLAVTGLGGSYVAGDTFKLFDALTYLASSFNTITLPANVTWNTSQLGANGTIQVVSVASPNITSVQSIGGNFQVNFSGPGGSSYRVFATTNLLATPITNTWTLVASGVIPNNGSATITDTTAASFPQRFYLISVP
jgi:autotransporter-associated beta strand protein